MQIYVSSYVFLVHTMLCLPLLGQDAQTIWNKTNEIRYKVVKEYVVASNEKSSSLL